MYVLPQIWQRCQHTLIHSFIIVSITFMTFYVFNLTKSCYSISDPNKPLLGEKVFLYKVFPSNSSSCLDIKKVKVVMSRQWNGFFCLEKMCLMRSEYISYKKDYSRIYLVSGFVFFEYVEIILGSKCSENICTRIFGYIKEKAWRGYLYVRWQINGYLSVTNFVLAFYLMSWIHNNLQEDATFNRTTVYLYLNVPWIVEIFILTG